MPKNQWGLQALAATAFVIVLLVAGSSLTSLGLASWYQTLALPSYEPPGSVIGAVWTILYIMLAVAIVFSWKAEDKMFFRSLGPLYLANGVLNVLWSFVFFGMHELTGAAVTAGLLGCSVLVLIFANLKSSKIAALLLVPYFLWVSFAAVLNLRIAVLNHPMDSIIVTQVNQGSTTVTLTIGIQKQIDEHLSLKVDTINDSRCPDVEGVNCIWQGELSPQLSATLDGVVSQVRLGTVTAKEADIGTYHLTLVEAGLESATIKVELP